MDEFAVGLLTRPAAFRLHRRTVVTGGSRRGWTTWLTAVADPQVAGIAPILIDMQNLREQLKHQLDS